MGLEPAARSQIVYILYPLHDQLDTKLYCLLWFFHLRPAIQLTVTGVALSQKKFGDPWFSLLVASREIGVKINSDKTK